MKTLKLLIAVIMGVTFFNVNSLSAQNADSIMKKVDNRTTPKDMKSQMKMNLVNSKHETTQKTMKCFMKGDDKMMIFFQSPADVKGSSFLKISHDDKDDDMWVYLPALGKVRRIASNQKNGSFMGSDFTYEDMGDRNLNDYTYAYVKTETYSGVQCYVIKSTPKTGVTSDYSSIYSWIRTDNYFPIKETYYNKTGMLTKTKTVELTVSGTYYIPKKITMYDLKAYHATEIVFSDIVVDSGVDATMFDQNNMTKVY